MTTWRQCSSGINALLIWKPNHYFLKSLIGLDFYAKALCIWWLHSESQVRVVGFFKRDLLSVAADGLVHANNAIFLFHAGNRMAYGESRAISLHQTTAQTTTEPARQPHPTSSIPTTKILPSLGKISCVMALAGTVQALITEEKCAGWMLSQREKMRFLLL